MLSPAVSLLLPCTGTCVHDLGQVGADGGRAGPCSPPVAGGAGGGAAAGVVACGAGGGAYMPPQGCISQGGIAPACAVGVAGMGGRGMEGSRGAGAREF